MDLDALAAARAAAWDRLEQLGRARTLTGQEADELITRYQAAASDLAAVHAAAGRSAVEARLSVLVARARLRFAGTPANPFESLPRLLLLHIPAALYRVRWLTLAVAGATALIAFLYWLWGASSPEFMAALAQQADLEQVAKEDFVGYYSEYSGGAFTSLVWTNNAWIAAQSIAFGITGVFVPYVIVMNAQNLGVTAAIMHEYDRLDVFFAYISPHGLLELYCIFVAGAAGLLIFWAWVVPGARTRGQALAQDGRALMTLAVALAIGLLVSGVIEGFVTRQAWPWWIKTGIGAVALAGFLWVQWGLGRRAARAGETGDLEAFEAGATRLVAG